MAEGPRDERTPLLNGSSSPSGTNTNGTGSGCHVTVDEPGKGPAAQPSWLTRIFGPPNTIKVLLAGLIISFSFSFTQVPIFYVFHLMECDVYYETHPPYTGPGDRCALNEIAAGTATQFSILGMSTTFCGTLNLFVTGWTVKKWGPRFALVLQTFIPAIRVSAQVLGVIAGGNAGITIIQSTQLITILGGPAGYILVVNTIAGELVEPIQRTAVFGQLQGCLMLGQATGYLLGGMVGDEFGARMPFQVAFFLFLLSSCYAAFVLPYISPESLTDGKRDARRRGVSGFLAPLKIMSAQGLRLASGHVAKHYGVLFLCCGIFLGVLATGYAPLLIQMYATAYFDFSQADNGWLMSGNALIRSFFLFFIFPHIITRGRNWFLASWKGAAAVEQPSQAAAAAASKHHGDRRPSEAGGDGLARVPSRPEQMEAPMAGNQVDEGPQSPSQHGDSAEEERVACRFDLFFLRWSLLVDGILTAGAALCTQKWHIYLGESSVRPPPGHESRRTSVYFRSETDPPFFLSFFVASSGFLASLWLGLGTGRKRRHYGNVPEFAADGCAQCRDAGREHCPPGHAGAVWLRVLCPRRDWPGLSDVLRKRCRCRRGHGGAVSLALPTARCHDGGGRGRGRRRRCRGQRPARQSRVSRNGPVINTERAVRDSMAWHLILVHHGEREREREGSYVKSVVGSPIPIPISSVHPSLDK